MQTFKRVMAMVLTLVMLLTITPLGALAAEPAASSRVNTDSVTIEGTNDFGNLLSRDIIRERTDTAECEDSYGVTNLEITGNVATVTYDALEEAVLIVALYSEDGMQLLASGKTTVSPDTREAAVTIQGTMPEYFRASAYLVEAYDLTPLCAAYETPMYTRSMQELLASTVEDYAPEQVLNLDEDETTNFAVYAETTKVIHYAQGHNTVASVDRENAVYIIENADEQFTKLKKGDIFAYSYGENEILIAKVKSIQISGTTVTITGDALEMADVFSHVKIESSGTTADMTVDESTCGDGVTYLGVTEGNQGVQTYAAEGDGSNEYGFRFGINEDIIDETSTEYPKSKIHVEGTLDFALELEFQYYISWQEQYVKFFITHKLGVTLNFEGKITAVLNGIPEFNFSPIKAIFIGFAPEFEFAVSAKVEISCVFHGESGFIWEDQSVRPIRANPRMEGEVFFEGTIFLGFDMKPTIRIISEDFLDMEADALIGLELAGKLNVEEHEITTEYYPDTKHECERCLDITMSFISESSVSIQLFCHTSWTFDLGKMKLGLGKWYASFDFGDSGKGECPHLLYKITAKVVDEENQAVSGAQVVMEEEQRSTNGSGIAVFYRKAEKYTVTASANGLAASATAMVRERPCKVVLMLREDDEEIPGGILGSVEDSEVVDESIVAEGDLGEGITWILHSNGLLEILGSGTMRSFSEAPWKKRMDEITSMRMDEGILNLSGYAFMGADNLVHADLPESLTSIGNYAFQGSGITGIRIPKAVGSIGTSAFSDCDSLVSAYIDGTDMTIHNCAFYSCDNLQTVEIVGSVTSIGLECFQSCKSLTTVVLPETLQTVGKNLFYKCSSLCQINLPASLTTLSDAMFQSCTSLSDITIPNTVTKIGANAFAGTGLTEVAIPKSVTTIGASAFSDCEALVSAYVDGTDMTIGNCAFYSCDTLQTVEIVGSATSIGLECFQNCKALTSAVLPETLQTVGKNLFFGCKNLVEVNLPASLTRLSDYMFQSCESLSDIDIPDTVTYIGICAFYETALTTVWIPESVTAIGSSAFYNCKALSSAYIDGTDLTIGNFAFSGCSSLDNVHLYAEDVVLNIYVFANLDTMDSITFYGNAPSFGSYVFSGTTVPAAYYPADNDTWTAGVLLGYGGKVTWIPSNLGGNAVSEEVPALDTMVNQPVGEETTAELVTEQPSDAFGSQDTATVDAVYGGEYGTEITDTYPLKTASFTGLVPGAEYLLLAMKSIQVQDPLAADNLLFIDQAQAAEDGTLVFTYVQRETTEISYVVACGASNKNLQDAVITFPEMKADGEVQVVEPVVVYGGETLTEGKDYTITGTVSFTEAGTYTCYIRGIHNYTGTVECSYTVKYNVTATAKIISYSTSLGGNIAMNFYVELSEDLVADPDAYIQFSFAGQTKKVPVSEGVLSGTSYRFACPITSKNMTDDITAQVYNADGPVGDPKTMAVDTYCNWIIANTSDQKTINLMKAMLNYGASAQMLFSYRTDDLANSALSAADKAFGKVDASAFAHNRVGEEDGIKPVSYTLLLDSETTVRCYFQLTGDKSIDAFTFTVDGVEVEPVYKDGYYYIEKANIAAHRLDDMHTFTCGNITITYGGLSYVNQVMTYYTSGTTFDMASALYAYSKAAEAYIG